MSIWGHISGNIRIDGISSKCPLDIGTETKDYYYKNYPKCKKKRRARQAAATRNWNKAKKSGIPMGSEGSLNWKWMKYDYNKFSGRKGSYVIYGDLRDFDDPNIIFKWSKHIFAKLDSIRGVYVRQFTIEVNIEGKEKVLITNTWNEQTSKDELVMLRSTKVGNILFGDNK